MINARIVGTGSTTPRRILTNKDLEAIVDTSDEWITRRTGIKERRISTNGRGENTSELATSASLKALEMAGTLPETLDMIVVGTVTPDRQFPSAACFVQKALQASKAVAFDVVDDHAEAYASRLLDLFDQKEAEIWRSEWKKQAI